MATQVVTLRMADRTAILLFNVAVSYGLYVLTSGNWLLSGNLKSVWLFAAIALWFLALLSAPWFVPPRDALANAVASASLLAASDLSVVASFRAELSVIRWRALAYCALIAILALIALLNGSGEERTAFGRSVFRLAATLGRAEMLYTPVAMVSVVGGYYSSPPAMAWLFIFWVFFVVVRPTERIALAWQQWNADRSATLLFPGVGTIERIDHPDIVRVKLTKGASWKPDMLHTAALSDGDQRFVIALFAQIQGTEVMGTGLCVADVAEPIPADQSQVYATHDDQRAADFVERLSGTKGSELVGFAVERSSIGVLRFEVSTSIELSEGDVVFSRLNAQDVFYQIIDAETSEESFDQNPRGTHIVRAAQLGCYDPDRGFYKYSWLPSMNTPIFWAKKRTFAPPKLGEDDFIIGDVPSTNIGVVANVTSLVEYHTAILGVTGTGKTELALDIVRESIPRGTKVFCVDFTGEYRARLDDLDPLTPSPSEKEISDLEAKLFAAETGTYGAGAEKKALSSALKTMHGAIDKEIEQFLIADDHNVAVLELAEIANTKATLRLTEMYLSAVMGWARANRRARQILIVLEEAHTIIPETHGAGFDYDTQWVVSRIGQIALQGRKYGVGLLVVSQRTALVSKTILSQCNTFLTHSLIDETSLRFLQSVYSIEHTRLIPDLGQFEFLGFGKALRAERPILLRRPFDPRKKEASDKLKKSLPLLDPSATGEEPAVESAEGPKITNL